MFYVVFEPFQLIVAKRAQTSGLQIHHVYQSDEMHALLLEAVPARSLASLSVTLKKLFPVVIQHIVLAGHVKDILRIRAFQNLVNRIELLRLRKMADVSRMQQEFRL